MVSQQGALFLMEVSLDDDDDDFLGPENRAQVFVYWELRALSMGVCLQLKFGVFVMC